jgi:hypothetical protein
MHIGLTQFALAAATCCLGGSLAFAETAPPKDAPIKAGSWSFDTGNQGHPDLVFKDEGRMVFQVFCAHAFGLRAVYPGMPGKDEEKATITIANGKTIMMIKGAMENPVAPIDPPDTTHFAQYNLGYDSQDPNLFKRKWRAEESRLLDFLDSGQPLTISADGQSFVLPPIDVRGWKAQFKKIC